MRNKLKNKSIDYIFGMITGASLMRAFWACASNDLAVTGSEVQQVETVNSNRYLPVYVEVRFGGFRFSESIGCYS